MVGSKSLETPLKFRKKNTNMSPLVSFAALVVVALAAGTTLAFGPGGEREAVAIAGHHHHHKGSSHQHPKQHNDDNDRRHPQPHRHRRHHDDDDDRNANRASLSNISAIYECNDNCTVGCVPASLPQGQCVYVPPAHSYVIYRCINNSTQVQLKVYGPFEFLCSNDNPLHLTFTYDVDTCVLPKAGGYTQYHCPDEQ